MTMGKDTGATAAAAGVTGQLRLVALVELPADRVEVGQRYEDRVLALLGRHGGRVERRLRTTDGRTEVHLLWFASRAGYESFLADPERAAYRAELGDAAPSGRVLEVDEVWPRSGSGQSEQTG